MAPFPRKRNEAVLNPSSAGNFFMFYMKMFQPCLLVPRELLHDPAKPQHGPTVLIGYKFKAVWLFKNLGASIASFPSCQVPLLRGHATLVDLQQESHWAGKRRERPAMPVKLRCEHFSQTKNRGMLLRKERMNFLANVGKRGDLFCYSMVLIKSLL